MSDHGTIARYQKHYRDGETPCADCKAAAYAYKAEHQAPRSDEQRAKDRSHSSRRQAAVRALIAMYPADFQRLLTQQQETSDEQHD